VQMPEELRLIRRFPNLLLLRSCLWQSISTFPRSRFALRAAFGRVGSHSSRNVSPFGLLMQPTAQPPCCLVPGQRPLARVPVSSPPSVPQRPCESPSSRQAALRACILGPLGDPTLPWFSIRGHLPSFAGTQNPEKTSRLPPNDLRSQAGRLRYIQKSKSKLLLVSRHKKTRCRFCEGTLLP
jgi:hypothetical protein